ncbi:septum site-determining protein MinC [Acidithiobacillus sp. CV18-2]|uniref:Probable septum site-determining protein MinC n=1 Tax=Igneacidithiobacillus copahuensis TaxID=2724909 RepID=A0AAE2YN91_9PROT|nr:septum site-determining protein MinC [Igneacidithiobacillus copahuensis]MBU2754559.1 septum site-determining protein MinC [Acidithiobacillus sp. CV18-3]MBU2757279.1 septum site-determining protein MinC [Acidithiobacillus sp. BN09-2]MBU2776848.1 septum site-determining protein MinC [Acidithiobacillus sp. CV18-2]MBU2796275.1 septum site-determining protein MinC [Acidithiobacillus sp. VAN18-2]MBU2799422.1 septum site-determining protein MinC [Acidithiobacillus sp. VAN18-4]UTV81068.1 septum si
MNPTPKSILRLSGGVFTLSVLRLTDASVKTLQAELAAQGSALRLVEGAAVVLDLTDIDPSLSLPYTEWLETLREAGCFPIGVRNVSDEQAEAAAALGLPHLRGSDAKIATAPSNVPLVTHAAAGSVFSQPLRSGQRQYARGGDLVCLGAVNAGAEVLADGHVHVYGPLRGRALAGVQGDESARIFCQRLEAELVAIAGVYMTLDAEHPLWGKAAQVSLDGEHLHIIALEN